jgi:hypothetical protein
MTRRRPPVVVREAVAAIGARGRAIDVDLLGTHIKIRWEAGGRRMLVVSSRASRDHRTNHNTRTTLHQLLTQEEQP